MSPGAKRGSTAPYAYADTLLVEVGARQPRTLANAYLRPVPLRGDVAAEARRLLIDELAEIDANYGAHESRRVMTRRGQELNGLARATLPEIAAFAAEAVREGVG